MNGRVFEHSIRLSFSAAARVLGNSKEITLLAVALAALQDQAVVLDVLDNTSKLSVEIDAAVVASPVVDTVILQCLQDFPETTVVACVGRTRWTSGLSSTARTYEC